MNNLTTLKENLKEWTDFDVAEFQLAVCLGLMPNDWKNFGSRKAKHVFWSANPVGDTLHTIIEELTDIGILEYDEKKDKWRWNKEFNGSWE